MKLKHMALCCLALAIVFITAQSFYTQYIQKRFPVAVSSFRGFDNVSAFCGNFTGIADSTADIPALKGWGNYSFKISTKSDSAQFYFNQGLSMYYSFHTIEAIASFTKATHLDPAAAMAWYGKSLAMGPTINYPNGYVAPTGAYEASVEGKLKMAGCTPLEKDLILAMEQRYSRDSTVSVLQLRKNYATAMQAVYEKYPDNPDVITLYADALMLLHPWDLYEHQAAKPKTWTTQIRTLLEKAITIYPKHPGANHYYIHTMEGSATPEMANNSAHLLDTLMPQVSHITHMPSHIYIRTGEFEQGIKDNDRGIAGFNSYQQQYAPIMNGFGLYVAHNQQLKVGCAQLAGSYQIAGSTATELKNSLPPTILGIKGAEGNYIQYIYMQQSLTDVKFGKWDEVLKVKTVDSLPYAALLNHFAHGMAWSGKGNVAKAKAELKLLNVKLQDSSLKARNENFSTAYEAALVAQLTLQGAIARTEKHTAEAIGFFRKAVVAEDQMPYNEPRDWSLPARHYLGKVLLEAGQYKEAAVVFNEDLLINRKNIWALTGLEQAEQKAGNSVSLTATKQRLAAASKLKDLPIVSSAF